MQTWSHEYNGNTMGCRVERGATGSHLIATVNCHSSFLLPCYPPPWTNIPPRQFRRATTNQLSSSRSQIRSSIVQIPAFHSPTIITQPMSSQHFSHPAAPTMIQPSTNPGPILPFTSDIQSSLSQLPSPASPPLDDSAPSSSASSSSMLGRSLFSSFGNAWLNS